MTESGKVKKIVDGRATVELPRKSSCEKCGMCLVAPSKQVVTITLENTVGANLGDIVEISMGAGYVFAASLLTYIVPLMFFALGLTLGVLLLGELAGIIASVCFAVLGYIVVAVADKKLKIKRGFAPQITKIIKKENTNEQ